MSDNTPESGEPAVKRVRKTATRTPKASSADTPLPQTPAPAAPQPAQAEPAPPAAPPAAPRAADSAPAEGGQVQATQIGAVGKAQLAQLIDKAL